MRTITLVDGTVFNGQIMPNGDDLFIYVYLDGVSLVEGFMAFSNAENISVLVATYQDNVHTYEGFTEIWAINHEFGNCNIVLRRANNA